ncbi:hypothetical protein AAG565_13420 [Fontimonas sp. SYSU GA230001]|uniref:hypothetical protein n=1 Tax=Fontimonas sp. SYSU GA230001 TaxID=3142450 RepID=UPI0032B3D91D
MSEATISRRTETAGDPGTWSARAVTLAVDAAEPPRDAIALALRVARHFTAALSGVLVENDALLRAAGLPFTTEINRHSGTERPFDAGTLERRYRHAARELHDLLGAQGATAIDVRARRGEPARVVSECFAVSDILVIGRTPRSRWSTPPETAPLRLDRLGTDRRRLDAVAAALQAAGRPWPWQTLRHDRDTVLAAQLRERRPSLVLADLGESGADEQLRALLEALDCPLVLLR